MTLESDPPVETTIIPRVRDLGDGFQVRRVLPWAGGRMVGPFIFFDQMGPTVLQPGQGLDVRPHPHIGLATVTYLFNGEILHRDSLGSVQPIRPGEVNWMTAGRGIVHSERTPAELRPKGGALFGIQTWVALPLSAEETEPDFLHVGSDALPAASDRGVRLRIIAGSFGGLRAPVRTFSEMFYVDAELDAGAAVELPAEAESRAAYVISGAVQAGSLTCEPAQMIVFRPGAGVTLRATAASRLLLLGGAVLEGKRHIWWNFVSSSPERIEQAKADWKAGRFAGVAGETDVIPLPESSPALPVRYP
jgi:redox-sensitive bicupin YhaK (pirin superfamily)